METDHDRGTHPEARTDRAADEVQELETSVARRVQHRMTAWLARYSIVVLRISLGLVFLGFGMLKFFPGASPAEELAVRTLDTLSLGILSGDVALRVSALAECFIGLTLITGKLLRTGLAVLAVSLVGIMSPVVLFFGDLFPGAPTLEAQYVLKDIVLVAAGMVIAARALGARLVADGSSDTAV
ncbi:MAG: DoxX family protein [Jiangellaceae bacterium]